MTSIETTEPTVSVSDNERAPKRMPTHNLWDVQPREGQRPFWNKVGAAFVNRDQSHTLLVYRPGIADPRRLQLRPIDREKRPLKGGADPKKFPTHELYEVIEQEGMPNDWLRVGVGFTNKDSSLSLVIDDGDREAPKARFQLRSRRRVEPEAGPLRPRERGLEPPVPTVRVRDKKAVTP
jgi:hypothetical protein